MQNLLHLPGYLKSSLYGYITIPNGAFMLHTLLFGVIRVHPVQVHLLLIQWAEPKGAKSQLHFTASSHIPQAQRQSKQTSSNCMT